MQYTTKNKYGETVPVDVATREKLLQSGKRKPQDFNLVPEVRSLDVDGPRPVAQQESTRVAPKQDKRETQNKLVEFFGKNIKAALPTATDPNKSVGQRIVGAVTDIASSPLRQVAGIGAGLGELAGGGNYFDAFNEAAASPSMEAERNIGEGDVLGSATARRLAASLAEDPTALPSMLMPVSGAANIAKLVGMNAVGHAAQRYATDDNATTGDYVKGGLLDAAPVGIAGVSKLGGKFVKEVAGETGKSNAIASLMKSLKAAPMVKGGTEWEGLKQGLSGKFEGKPIFKQIVSKTDLTPSRVGERYEDLKAVVDSRFQPIRDELTNTGVTIDLPKAMKGAISRVEDNASSGRLPISPSEQINAEKWAKARALKPDDKDTYSKLMDIKRGTAEKYVPVSGPNKGIETYRFSDGTKVPVDDFHASVDGMLQTASPDYAHRTGSNLMKEAFKNPEKSTARSDMAYSLAKEIRDQMTEPVNTSSALARKAAMEGDEYAKHFARKAAGVTKEVKRGNSVVETTIPRSQWTPEQKKAYNAAIKQILDNRNTAKGKWSEQLAASEPFYQMQPAMDRAIHTGGNRNHLGLGDVVLAGGAMGALGASLAHPSALAGIPMAALAAYSNRPGFSRALWDLSDVRALNELDKLRGSELSKALQSATGRLISTKSQPKKKEGK